MLFLGVNPNQVDPFLSNTPIFIFTGGMLFPGEPITNVTKAITALKHGQFVLIYDNDSREGETDLVIPSQFTTPEAIKRMRKDGGGLIFLMTSHAVAQKLQLPFLTDLFAHISSEYPVLNKLVANDIPYDTKSSFSLYINHRKTFTGITDNDRSLTMKQFAELITKIKNQDTTTAIHTFGHEFRSPGHIPICVASEKLLNERKGHTELVIALLEMTQLIPAGSGCEIMGEKGKALPKTEAKRYAEKNHFVYLEGSEIEKAWKQWSK